MTSFKTLAPLCASLILCAGLACADDAGANKSAAAEVVVGRVNGEAISLDVIKTLYDKAKGSFGNASFEQAFAAVRDEVIAQRALLVDAKKTGVDQDPEVVKEIAETTAAIIWRANLTRRVTALVTDAAISEKYLELVKSYENKEEVHARHILVATEAEAAELIKKLQEGADFVALAKEHSTDKGSGSNGGDLGFFGEGVMVQDFSAAAFALKPGAMTEKPVKTQFGWHVIKLEERRKMTPPSLDGVKAQIQNQLRQQKTKEVIAAVEAALEIQKFNQDGSPVEKK